MNTPACAHSGPLFPSLDLGLGTSGLGNPSVLLGGASGLGSSEVELQKMVMDERMRCENHKTNYQTLKAEHARLQDELSRVQADLRRLLADKQSQQEKLPLLMAEFRGELLDKTRELEELRLQVLTPHRVELLRAQVQQEMEAPVRQRFNKLEEETEKYRSDYNKLRHEYTILRTEFDHQREASARLLEEGKIHFEAEVSRWERDRAELVSQLQGSDPCRDGKRVEALLREKAQLHLRLKGLEAEVAELRTQRDNSGQQADNVQRIQVRQLAESQAAVKTLEAERQSVRLRSEHLESELQLSHEQNTLLTSRLHKAEREASSLTNQVEGMKHSHKLEVANVKLECVRSKVEVERERDTLQTQMDGLQGDVEVLKGTVERQREVLAEKERELVRRVTAAREEEFRKITTLHEEKLELENRLAELEQKRTLLESADHAHKEEWEGRLHGAQQGEESARKEVQTLRAKLQQQGSHLEELERQRTENTDLRQQNQALEVQLGSLSHSERELLEDTQRLREELRTARGQAERSQHDGERLLEEQKVAWLEEKQQLQERLAELQEKYGHAKDKLQRAALAQKKRKTLTENKEKRYQEKIQLLEAQRAELELQASVANKRPSYSDEHAALNRRLKELQRRHGEFRHLLLGNQTTSLPGPALRTSTPAPALPPGTVSLHEERFERELSLLRQRLEELECSQQQQLEILGSSTEKGRGSELGSPTERARGSGNPDTNPEL